MKAGKKTPPKPSAKKPLRKRPVLAGEIQGPESTKDRSTTWKPGTSGNPAGKPAGTRNKATAMVQALLDRGAESITKAIIAAAQQGDMTAAKLVLERLSPPVRERTISIALPDTTSAVGISAAQQAIVQAVGNGELLPSEANTLAGIVENRRKAHETEVLEGRIAALEARK